MGDEEDKFLEEYLKVMGEIGEEIFGFHYIEEYVKLFPKNDEQSVRDSLIKLAESFHKGYNTPAVVILINKGLVKYWLENNNVTDGYGRIISFNE